MKIGLFGTYGDTTFREKMFIPSYKNLNINYFNPQVKNWNKELAKIEAENLKTNEILLFPITGDTSGLGSLTEISFSILNLEKDRYLIIFIDMNLKIDKCKEESLRMRNLVKSHLSKINKNNVIIVNSLNEMLDKSIEIYEKIKKEDNE